MKTAAMRIVLRVIDLVVLCAAFALAFMIRFEWALPIGMWKRLMFTLPYVVLLQYGVLVVFGVPRFSWRYVSLRDASRILQALGLATVILLAVRALAELVLPTFGYALYAIIPVGVVLIDFTLALFGIAGVRALRRIHAESEAKGRLRTSAKAETPTLLIGAGQAGVMVARELASRPDLGMKPVGFLDDDPGKMGAVVHGIPVLGSTRELADLAAKHAARQALITMANVPGREIRRIHSLCERARLPVKIIPGIYEIVGGQVNLSRIRDVAIEDLLRREPAVLDEELIAEGLRNRVVLITGAGGSIGSELCRQVCRFSPAKLILCEQAENSLFEIHREIRQTHAECCAVPCVADICDSRRIERIFATYRPEYVFHAAAHKHVPMMEWNPGEAVKNNVFGTRKVADLAHQYGVSRFVMISTDKAVNPTSVMGATKRTAEMYVQALSQSSSTRFVTVRFGNVLGSAGSVVPIFKEQILAGGPITVTHPEMKRYFMTIPEACQLVLEAGAMGRGGEIFVLDMGEPVRIADLARDLIRLSGLRSEDIEIVYTGLRPGEKLFEELSVADESADKTRHPKIFIGRLTPHAYADVTAQLETLHTVIAHEAAPERIRDALRQVVPEYSPALISEPEPTPALEARAEVALEQAS